MDWNSYLFLTQVLVSSVIQSNGYVLLAANLDDFKSIAKKFVPDELAEQLAELASKSVVKYKELNTFTEKSKVSMSESDTEEDSSGVRQRVEQETTKDERETKRVERKMKTVEKVTKRVEQDKKREPDMDFEKLVEKVKERLKKELIEEQKVRLEKLQLPRPENNNHQIKRPNPEDSFINRENIGRLDLARFGQKNKENIKKHINKIKEDRDNNNKNNQQYEINVREEEGIVYDDSNQDHEREIIEFEVKPDDDMTFSKIQIANNDSYEDYVTPERSRNIFESDNEKLSETIPDTFIVTAREKAKAQISNDYAENVKEYEVEELKAQTEDLWYDYKSNNNNNTEDYTENTTHMRKTTKVKPNTMIPKRDFYKMSSPNYFAKVPIVAEKYDFNEPIPEKDRVPEDLKPVPHLPSVINGKVKFSKKR